MESIKEFPRGIPAGTGGALCVDPEAGSDQVISANKLDGDMKVRAPGPGQELGQVQPCDREATPSSKPQATSYKLQATSSQASSDKPQALRCKHQATSRKQQAL